MHQNTRTAPAPLPGPVVSEDVASLNLPDVRSKTGGVMAIIPTTWAEVAAMASAICRAEMAPKSYQQKADKVAVAIMAGLEVGFTPMVALQSIAVINGQPSIYGDGLLALIMGSGLLEDFEETRVVDDKGIIQSATCKMWRRGRKTPSVQTITRAMVNQAGWFKKEGPWQATPDRMFQMRARGWCGRDAFPDVLRGLRSAEEVLDMLDVTPHGSATTEPPTEPRREDFAAPTQTDNQPSGGTPLNDTPPAAGQGAATQRDGAPAGGGTSASGQPGAADKPKPASRKAAAKAKATDVVDENEDKPEVDETAARPVVEGEIDTEIKFDRYSSAGAFYEFSDTFLQSTATTPAMARAWRTFYHPQISQFLAHERETVRAEINDTLTLYLKKVGIAPEPQQQREPGEEG